MILDRQCRIRYLKIYYFQILKYYSMKCNVISAEDQKIDLLLCDKLILIFLNKKMILFSVRDKGINRY